MSNSNRPASGPSVPHEGHGMGSGTEEAVE
jgi:hypothetical protein